MSSPTSSTARLLLNLSRPCPVLLPLPASVVLRLFMYDLRLSYPRSASRHVTDLFKLAEGQVGTDYATLPLHTYEHDIRSLS